MKHVLLRISLMTQKITNIDFAVITSPFAFPLGAVLDGRKWPTCAPPGEQNKEQRKEKRNV